MVDHPSFLRPLLCSLLLSVTVGVSGFALLMQHLKETFAERWGSYPELWDWTQDAPDAALFALLLGGAVLLAAHRLFFRPSTHGMRWLSGLLTAWGITLLLPAWGAWLDACKGMHGPGFIPFTVCCGFAAVFFIVIEALIAALFCALSRPRKGYRA